MGKGGVGEGRRGGRGREGEGGEVAGEKEEEGEGLFENTSTQDVKGGDSFWLAHNVQPKHESSHGSSLGNVGEH